MNGHDDRHPDEMISALFDGELAPEEWAAAKGHLEGCPRCRRLLEEIKSISAAMPADPPVPEGLAARVKDRLPAGTGRQRPAPPPREPVPFKPARRRITFPLAAGAGLAAALIVGALLVQYVPSSVLSRLRLPVLSAEEGAEGLGGAGGAREQGSAEAKDAAETGDDASAGAVELASAEVAQETLVLPPGAPVASAGSDAGAPAVAPPGDFAAEGERPGLAPGQELPVTVPEEADEPVRSAEEIALDAGRQGPVGGVEGRAVTIANEMPAPSEDEQTRAGAGMAKERVPPSAAAKAAAAAAPPVPGEAPRDRSAEAAPIPSAASVAECRATWGSPRQVNWPASAGLKPERAIGGAAKAAGGKSIVLENPRRVRITVTRERWPALMQRLADTGVAGTAQLPAPPEWADCAAVSVSVPEVPAAPPSSAPPSPETPSSPPPAT